MVVGRPGGRRLARGWWLTVVAAVVLVVLVVLAPLRPASAEEGADQRFVPIVPFTSWTDFLDQVYADLLPAPPSASTRLTIADALRHGRTSPGLVVADIRAGADHTANVDPVARLYRAFFLRIPDASGLRHWIAVRRSGWTLGRIADSFARSGEFTRRYGSLGNRDFVRLIYTNVLERTPDPGGVDYWTGRLDQGRSTRGSVMTGFSESAEYRTKQASEVTASVLPILLLGRAPTVGEFQAAVARLDAGATVDAEARTIVSSDPYIWRAARQRVVVFGDSIPQSLIEDGARPSNLAAYDLYDGTVPACDGADHPPPALTREGVVHFMTPECAKGWKKQYPPFLQHPADRAFVMTGVNAMLDHKLGGAWRHPCDATARSWYHDDLAARLAYLKTRAARVVLVLPAWPEENSQWIMPPDWVRRADCVRSVMAQAARDTGGITTIDLGAELCPSGPYRCRPMRELDGIHVDVRYAPEVLAWLLRASSPATRAADPALAPTAEEPAADAEPSPDATAPVAPSPPVPSNEIRFSKPGA